MFLLFTLNHTASFHHFNRNFYYYMFLLPWKCSFMHKFINIIQKVKVLLFLKKIFNMSIDIKILMRWSLRFCSIVNNHLASWHEDMIYLFVMHECMRLPDINQGIKRSKPQIESHKEKFIWVHHKLFNATYKWKYKVLPQLFLDALQTNIKPRWK